MRGAIEKLAKEFKEHAAKLIAVRRHQNGASGLLRSGIALATRRFCCFDRSN